MSKVFLKPIPPTPTARFQRTGISSGKMIFNQNEVVMCCICLDIDGFWKIDVESFGAGLIESAHMKMICNKLDEINQGFEDELAEYFNSLPTDANVTTYQNDIPF